MRYLLQSVGLALLCAVGVHPQNPARICVRHITFPTRYPNVARFARLQGTVIAKLRIAADGNVTEITVEVEDPILNAHPLLQSETKQLVREWTFECQSCPSDGTFEHVIKFHYRLEGEDAEYDDTRVRLDLPDAVTIVARPPACDHCPTARKKM